MNVQRFAFSILMMVAVALLAAPQAASAQGCGCGGQHASSGGCGGGCGDDLWAGWCNNGCDSCNTGCGRRFGLFRGFGLGAGCCIPSDPMGWNLNPGCGGCGAGACDMCNTCQRPRLFGRCGCRPHRLFGRRRGCDMGCATDCCDTGCTGCNRCGRLGLFSGRFRLRCGNFRLFNSPRCDSGYTGCNADTCGCMGESFYQDTMIDGHMHDGHSHMYDEYPQGQMVPDGQYNELPGDSQPYEGDVQPNQLQPIPSEDGNAPQNSLPQPTEGDSTAAFRTRLIQPTQFDAPAIRFPSLLGGSY